MQRRGQPQIGVECRCAKATFFATIVVAAIRRWLFPALPPLHPSPGSRPVRSPAVTRCATWLYERHRVRPRVARSTQNLCTQKYYRTEDRTAKRQTFVDHPLPPSLQAPLLPPAGPPVLPPSLPPPVLPPLCRRCCHRASACASTSSSADGPASQSTVGVGRALQRSERNS